jgi:hypothetical protein
VGDVVFSVMHGLNSKSNIGEWLAVMDGLRHRFSHQVQRAFAIARIGDPLFGDGLGTAQKA